MKYLLEQLKVKFRHRKELEKFCSYHVKTAFFHVCTRDPQDSQWDTRDLELCFDKCVTYFLECLKTEQLKHYFIPGFNLFSRDQIDKINKEFLSQQIEYERKNGFPVFYEFWNYIFKKNQELEWLYNWNVWNLSHQWSTKRNVNNDLALNCLKKPESV